MIKSQGINEFAIVPDLLRNPSIDSERPWSLRQLGELLRIAYRLTDHPVLKNWKGHDAIDFFNNSIFNPDKTKRFNRTIVERTISQAQHYSQFKSDRGVLTMSSKGIEYSILNLETFITVANKLYESSENELEEMGAGVHFFRLTHSGEVEAAIMYLMDTCNNHIELIYKHHIQDKLLKIEKDDERIKFLLRQKANLLQLKDQFEERTFKHILQSIDVELGYHKEVKEYLDIPSELREIVTQFLAEKEARISNNKLLGKLLEEKLDEFCEGLRELVLELFSYHDVGGQEPEKVYHAFLLGVLNSFKDFYQMESNKEAGQGRFDIVLIPNTQDYKGLIIEVKRAPTDKTDEISRLQVEAMKQIEDNEYAVRLKCLGHTFYIAVAAVFFGKRLFLKHQFCQM